jgi:endonuclease/exonuclease/phosphatase family metal-dependent hydrolase
VRPVTLAYLSVVALCFALIGPGRADDEMPSKLTVATWNVKWFFDSYRGDNASDTAKANSARSAEAWEAKRAAVADVIAKINPTIIALQEVESLRVVRQLAQELQDRHKLDFRTAYCDGYDTATEQDVAILAQTGLISYGRRDQTRKMLADPQFYSLSKHLFARFRWGEGENREELTLFTVHMRAGDDGAPFRPRQARTLRHWVREHVERGENVIVLGDVNTSVPFGKDTAESELGILRGLDTSATDDDLADLHGFLPDDQRVTFFKSGGQYDRILPSRAVMTDVPSKKDLVYVSMERRADLVKGTTSDHYPLVLTLERK